MLALYTMLSIRIVHCRKFGEVSCSVQARGMNLNQFHVPMVEMKTRHPTKGYFHNEFPAICNHCRVMAAWSRKMLQMFEKFLHFKKMTLYRHGLIPGHILVCSWYELCSCNMKMCSYKSQFVQFILLTALNIFGNLLKSKHSLIISLFILQLQYINPAAPIAQIHHCSRVWLLTYSSVTIAACRTNVIVKLFATKWSTVLMNFYGKDF